MRVGGKFTVEGTSAQTGAAAHAAARETPMPVPYRLIESGMGQGADASVSRKSLEEQIVATLEEILAPHYP